VISRTRATQSRVSVSQRLNNRSFDDAINKLDYFEKKIEQMEGHIEAETMGRSGLHSEFEELEMQEKIDAELEALKQKMNKGESKADSKTVDSDKT